MATVDRSCAGCVYLVRAHYGPSCDYLTITGQRRGCPAGKGCTQRKTGPRPVSVTADLNSWVSYTRKQAKEAERAQKAAQTAQRARQRQDYEDMAMREAERKSEERRRYRAQAQGRQRAAIEEALERLGISRREFCRRCGIAPSTLSRWITECCPANWFRLEEMGVVKPEGLE